LLDSGTEAGVILGWAGRRDVFENHDLLKYCREKEEDGLLSMTEQKSMTIETSGHRPVPNEVITV